MIPSKINRKFLLSSHILTILQISLAISNVSLLLIIFILCWSIADLQCCVSFRWTAKWLSYLLFVHSIVATLCNPMDCSTSGFLVLSCLPEFIQTHVHWVNDASQQSHALSPPSLPAPNLSQHQGLFQWVSSSHQVDKVLELQHQSFQ